jgi:formate/nitrite transporter FocA (FNT family)
MATDIEDTHQLKPDEEQEAEHRTSVRAKVIHEAIRRDGEEEMNRSASALAWSGLAGGLAMGFSLVTESLLRHYLPDTEWAPLITKMGYPVGFLIVILGKQQLFTENTLTPIIPLMRSPTGEKFLKVMKLWAVVLLANIAGAHLIAWFISSTPVMKPEFHRAIAQAAHEATAVDFGSALIRGIPAGWLIALVVWLRAGVDTGEIVIIAVLTYVVGLGSFTHVIVGSIESLYLVFRGAAAWPSFLVGYFIPALIGNIIGGVSIVAALNHGQVVTEEH